MTTLYCRDYAEHDLVGNRTMIRFEQKQPDGTTFLVKRRYEYDELYQLTREITDGTINYDHEWQYDCVGNRVKFTKAETDETITYKYNAANQLIREVSNINGVTRYRYDANGNMIQKRCGWRTTRYVYDIEDRLRLAFGPEGLGFYLHDALGRRILRFGIPFKHKEASHFSAGMDSDAGKGGGASSKRQCGRGDSGGSSCCQRRLADEAAGRNTNPAADFDAVLQDWFDGMVMDLESGCRYGFRHLVRLIDGIKCRLPRKLRRRIVLERYFHDGADVIADYDLFGRFCKASYLTPFLDENLLVDRYFRFGRAKRYWYTQDGLGSVRQLISDSDSVLNSYTYTAWGVPLQWHETIFNRYTFTGREYNPETQLYHYRFREYAATVGLFLMEEGKAQNRLTAFGLPLCVMRRRDWLPPNLRLYTRTPTTMVDPIGTQERRREGGVDLVIAETRKRVMEAMRLSQDLRRRLEGLRNDVVRTLAEAQTGPGEVCFRAPDLPRYIRILKDAYKTIGRIVKNVQSAAATIQTRWARVEQLSAVLKTTHGVEKADEITKLITHEVWMIERLCETIKARHKESKFVSRNIGRVIEEAFAIVRTSRSGLSRAARVLAVATVLSAGGTLFEAGKAMIATSALVCHIAGGVMVLAGASCWWLAYKIYETRP